MLVVKHVLRKNNAKKTPVMVGFIPYESGCVTGVFLTLITGNRKTEKLKNQNYWLLYFKKPVNNQVTATGFYYYYYYYNIITGQVTLLF
jgi:hypothetical protein